MNAAVLPATALGVVKSAARLAVELILLAFLSIIKIWFLDLFSNRVCDLVHINDMLAVCL
jgi:hypothetical protein